MLTIVGMLVAQDTDRAKPATTETDDLVAFAQGANSDGADRGIRTFLTFGSNTGRNQTSNAQHPTPNSERRFRGSMFSVRCLPRRSLRRRWVRCSTFACCNVPHEAAIENQLSQGGGIGRRARLRIRPISLEGSYSPLHMSERGRPETTT